jgi:hypothetical protein
MFHTSYNPVDISLFIQVVVFWVVMPCNDVVSYHTIWRHNPEDDLNVHHHENLKSLIVHS